MGNLVLCQRFAGALISAADVSIKLYFDRQTFSEILVYACTAA